MSSTSSPTSGVPTEASPPHVVEDCLGVVQLLSDGTVKRIPPPLVLPGDDAPAAAADEPVKWKDVVYDDSNGLSLRMYVPSTRATEKLPVLVFFHGGGFVLGTFAMPNFHAACLRFAAELPAVVLAADYRLAPEHRLPAAHADAATLFSWLRAHASGSSTTDPWLAESADFNRVFVSGDSAGANIAHHLTVHISSGALAVAPLRVAGTVLLWPYFGGEHRTASESAACPSDTFLTLPLSDQMWRMALPEGASRDHPAANPFGSDSPALDAVNLPPLLVAAGDQDLLVDRIRNYVARVKDVGKRVELVEFVGLEHAFATFRPESEDAGELVRVVRRFVHGGAPLGAA